MKPSLQDLKEQPFLPSITEIERMDRIVRRYKKWKFEYNGYDGSLSFFAKILGSAALLAFLTLCAILKLISYG